MFGERLANTKSYLVWYERLSDMWLFTLEIGVPAGCSSFASLQKPAYVWTVALYCMGFVV